MTKPTAAEPIKRAVISFPDLFFRPGRIIQILPLAFLCLLPVERGEDSYVDLRAIASWRRGLQLSALGRMGQDGDHRSTQLDLIYPTMRFFGSFSLYLDIQYYRGYGESLLGYNQETDAWRVGFMLFR